MGEKKQTATIQNEKVQIFYVANKSVHIDI